MSISGTLIFCDFCGLDPWILVSGHRNKRCAGTATRGRGHSILFWHGCAASPPATLYLGEGIFVKNVTLPAAHPCIQHIPSAPPPSQELLSYDSSAAGVERPEVSIMLFLYPLQFFLVHVQCSTHENMMPPSGNEYGTNTSFTNDTVWMQRSSLVQSFSLMCPSSRRVTGSCVTFYSDCMGLRSVNQMKDDEGWPVYSGRD